MARPFSLDPLFRSITVLPGVGPRIAKLFEKLVGGLKVWNLLCHLPIDVVDRRTLSTLADAPVGAVVTLAVTVIKHTPNPRRNLPYRVHCIDENAPIDLVFFRAKRDWLEKQYPVHETIIISGKLDKYNGKFQIVHPEMAAKEAEKDSVAVLEPIYPLTAGLTNRVINKAIDAAMPTLPKLMEWIDPAHKKRENWPDWTAAVQTVHFKNIDKDENDFSELFSSFHPARARLAYDELLSNQLAIALVRQRQMQRKGRIFKRTGTLDDKFLSLLPFELTGAQKRCLDEIYDDMERPDRMLRLLQGDVGSGKTMVAALTMIRGLENNVQAALMAPTEILARQHAETLKPLFEQIGIRCVVLTGRDKGKTRDLLLQQIHNGAAQIIIGTHALFQKGVAFQDLGVAVIDEQHRFGVHQRMELSSKGNGVDILVMTATPIPRTLTLTAYGDMDCSRIDEKPPGRKPVDTLLMSKDKIEDMIAGVGRQVQTGARVYWVCPLVEESEVLNLTAAEERYQVLQSFFHDRVGLVHGKMKPAEKDDVMEKFINGDIDILVATTVIEVGVNVPEATVMVIEHAERFGLAQLHQLRGRVGRGADKSYCFLLYNPPLSENGKERLNTMRQTEDGFLIAEKDLKLRGGGEVLGVKQSGLPEFRFADLEDHADLLITARNDIKLILDKDPHLSSDRGKALLELLFLFERDQAIQYLQSG